MRKTLEGIRTMGTAANNKTGLAGRKHRVKTSTSLIAMTVYGLVVSNALAEAQLFDIDAGPAAKTLNEFAQQADVSVVYTYDAVEGYQTNPVDGSFEPDEALRLMVTGTGLSVFEGEGGAFAVRAAGPRASAASAVRVAQAEGETVNDGSSLQDEEDGDRGLLKRDEIVVTGTNIRGAQTASPVFSFDRDDIDKTGASTIPEFLSTVPQNFTGGITENNAGGNADPVGNTEIGTGTGVNLRGLGSGSTLVLLNGRRLAPSGFGGFTDITAIPTTAIKRVEILTDGASAIYGSDAVGGVINFTLLDDYDGAETRARFGTVTKGSSREYQASQVLGKAWESGNVLASYEYYRRSPLDAVDREFSENAPLGFTVLPEQKRHSVFLSASQDLTDNISLFALGNFFQRDSDFVGDFAQRTLNDTTVFGGSTGLNYDFDNSWLFEIVASYSENNTISDFVEFSTGAMLFASRATENGVLSIDAKADGNIFRVPGGAVKMAVGGQYRREDFVRNESTNVSNGIKFDRDVFAVFAEVFVPLVSSENALPGLRRLQLTVAGRYEDYEDVGDTFNPKFGVLWSPVEGLNFRGTYSTSFRAPTLRQLDITAGITAFIFPVSDPTIMGTTNLYAFSGSDPNLEPEEADIWTVGFDWEPGVIPALKVGATYFDIEYKNRIDLPIANFTLALINEAALGGLVTRNPTVAELNALIDESNLFFNFFGTPLDQVGAVFDFRVQNISTTITRGFDFQISYDVDTDVGDFGFNFNTQYLTKNDRQQVPGGPVENILNTVYTPVRFKSRGSLSWVKDGFSGILSVNHTTSYDDPRTIPATDIDSWTTVDLNLSYNTRDSLSVAGLNDIVFSANVSNLFDESPPFVTANGANINYDGANASPRGRFVSFQITKAW